MKYLLAILLLIPSLSFAEKLKLALNWKPEPQFGGFYAANLNGEFKKRGLDVEIIEGGSGTPTVQMLAHDKIPYAIVSGDEIVLSQDRNPAEKVVGVFASYQVYPCMIMSHSEKGFQKMSDVFTHEGSLAVQSGLPYYQFLAKKFEHSGIKAKTVPYLGGITSFLKDANLSQQGFVTSEPLAAAKAGASVKTFMVADEGFNPYTTVLAVKASYLKDHSAEVESFVKAVRAGWQAYLKDPEPVNKYMASLNKSMDLKTFAESAEAQKKLIQPAGSKLADLGHMQDDRWKALVDQMEQLKITKTKPAASELYKNID